MERFHLERWVLAVALAVMLCSVQAATQPALNCHEGVFGFSLFQQHSRWLTTNDKDASFVCNYASGGSAGVAISVEYRCETEADEVWDGLVEDWTGSDQAVKVGTMPRGTTPVANADLENEIIHLRQVKTDGGFRGYAGVFPKQERLFWRWNAFTIVRVIMLSGQNLTISTQGRAHLGSQALEQIVYPLVSEHVPSLLCPVARVVRRTPNRVEIIGNPAVQAREPDELFVGDTVRLTRESGATIAPFIEIEWLGWPRRGWRGLAVFRGQDTFFEEFTVQQTTGQTGWPSLVGGVLSFGKSFGVSWILKKATGSPGVGLFLNTTKSSTSRDLLFVELNSLVAIEPLPADSAHVLTLEGAPVLHYAGGQSSITVPAGQHTTIQHGVPSTAQAFDPNAVERWWTPYVDITPPPPPPTGDDAPFIESLDLPSQLAVGEATPWTLGFNDPNGDVTRIQFEAVTDGAWQPSGEFDPDVWGQARGTIRVQTRCSTVGTVRGRVRLRDAAGNLSRWHEYTYECVGQNGANQGEPPRIDGVGVPPELPLGTPVQWPLEFSDADGDVTAIQFEQFVEGTWQPAGDGDPNVAGQMRGTITVRTTCSRADTVRARVRLRDAAGNLSAWHEYAYVCVADEPPAGSSSIAEALDANANGLLDDSEIRTGIQLWVLGQAVPNTGGARINDGQIRQLIQMWILGESVSAEAEASAAGFSQALRVQSLAWTQPTPLSRTLTVRGRNVTATDVQVFDLGGRRILRAHGAGPTLRFQLLDASGRPLANGTYLVAVAARGADGATWRSGVQKLVVLR